MCWEPVDYLVLYHQEELPYDCIAEVLGIPLNTVRTHLHRTRKHLRAALATVAHTVESKVQTA